MKMTKNKEYFVNQTTSEIVLHSLMKNEFCTTDVSAAERVYANEVAELEKCYVKASYFAYPPSEHEYRHAIYCELFALDDEDEEPEYLKISDYYFER